MAPKSFAEKMDAIRAKYGDDDAERSHIEADELIVSVLRSLGYSEGCDIFESLEKWYA